jgi:serine/threonine protein kinase
MQDGSETQRSQLDRPADRGGEASRQIVEAVTVSVGEAAGTPVAADDDAAPQASENESDRVDRLLEQCLEQFLDRQPVEEIGQLRAFLPAADSATQQFLLVELIKLDLATRVETLHGASRDGQHGLPRVEDYVEQHHDLLSVDEVPLDLLMEEIQLRKEIGEQPDPREYAARFPQHARSVEELLGGRLQPSAEATASVASRKRPPEFKVGEQVDDFTIVQTLGSGAFANVYLARQESMSRLVALKVSKGSGEEPQALAQFDHPNIVRVFDERMVEQPPSHLLYMQFLPGGTLADVVSRVKHTPVGERSGELIVKSVDFALLQTAQLVPERSDIRERLRGMSWPMAVAWVGIQLARALESAHRRGVMHRDVKPANVLLSAEGVPKLADFNVSFSGIAGRAGAASSFGGSIGYMAPEHLRAISATALSQVEQVGARADLYSLGILLWELWQGHRPFETVGTPRSWTEAVQQQLESRDRIKPPDDGNSDALSRLLEKILRETLQKHPADRIGSGAELEARLVLALHPDAARIFDPDPGTWQGWLSRRSPWWVAALVILTPNAIAGVYGYAYNYADTLGPLFRRIAGLESTFQTLSTGINAVAFPLAVALVVYFTRRVVRGLEATANGRSAGTVELRDCLELANRAAVIGGMLWCLAAVLYPTVLWSLFPEFTWREFGHFFLSHVICGGVAAIYPYFGIMIYASTVLYPRMVRPTLKDPEFDQRVARLVRHCERYLLMACGVPLLGASLLIVSAPEAKDVMLIALAATAMGVLAAFKAYRLILRQWAAMAKVLSASEDTVIAG